MKKQIVLNIWWITLLLGLIMLVAHALSLNTVIVDNTSIILLIVIALSPFISAVTKIKFGDFEAEIDPKEVQKIKDQVSAQVTEADQANPTPEMENTVNAIQRLIDSDPILALAKLRIELEKILNKLYRMTHTVDQQRRPMSAGQLAYSLSTAEILPKDIAQSIREVISICNRAIHGEEIRHQDAVSVVEVGTSLLSELTFYVNDLALKPIESSEIDPTVLNEFMNARYRVTTITPLVDHPRKEVRIVDQEGLDELLEGYDEYAEFIVDVTKIDSLSAA
jgi:hypothetical protein